MSFVNIFGGNTVQPVYPSYSQLTLVAPITLSWPTQFQDTNNVVAAIMDINPSVGGITVTLPDATQTSVGQVIEFSNISGANSFNILNNSGGLIATLAVGNIVQIYLTDNTTVAGMWRVIPFGGGFTAVTSVAAVALTAGLTITGSPITSAGTFNFSLSNDLVALTGIATTGFAVRTGAGTWTTRALVSGANIALTNANGVAGNPTIALATTIAGITSLTVGNLNLSNNNIITTGGNNPIFITPNGTGTLNLGANGAPVTIDNNNNIVTSGSITAGSIITTTITGLTNLTVANLNFATNVISATPNNTAIHIQPSGNATLYLGSNAVPVTIDTNNNIVTGGNFTAAGITSTTLTSTTINGTTANITNVNSTTVTAQNLQASVSIVANFAPAPLARAFVTINGTVPSISNAFNMTNFVYVSTGKYTIDFSNPAPNTTYIVAASNSDAVSVCSVNITSRTTTTISITARNISTGAVQDTTVMLVVYY